MFITIFCDKLIALIKDAINNIETDSSWIEHYRQTEHQQISEFVALGLNESKATLRHKRVDRGCDGHLKDKQVRLSEANRLLNEVLELAHHSKRITVSAKTVENVRNNFRSYTAYWFKL